MEDKYFAPLTVEVDEGNGQKRKLYSNSTWMDEDARQKLFELVKNRTYWSRAAGFLTMYGMLEVPPSPTQAVVRVPFFGKYPLQHRAAFVVAPGLLAYFAFSKLYGSLTAETVRGLVAQGNTPFWKHEHRVPELDRVYFELDDRRNFEPNILHHGL